MITILEFKKIKFNGVKKYKFRLTLIKKKKVNFVFMKS